MLVTLSSAKGNKVRTTEISDHLDMHRILQDRCGCPRGAEVAVAVWLHALRTRGITMRTSSERRQRTQRLVTLNNANRKKVRTTAIADHLGTH